MNERIEKIAKESGMHETHFGYGRSYDNVIWGDSDIETFAENLIRQVAYDLMDTVSASPEHVEFVAKQYGVNL